MDAQIARPRIFLEELTLKRLPPSRFSEIKRLATPPPKLQQDNSYMCIYAPFWIVVF